MQPPNLLPYLGVGNQSHGPEICPCTAQENTQSIGRRASKMGYPINPKTQKKEGFIM
jgi:hypothetical protein